MRWGLVPWWAKDIKVGFSSINARTETVDTTSSFRHAWKEGQRRLVVTYGACSSPTRAQSCPAQSSTWVGRTRDEKIIAVSALKLTECSPA
jgi:putative SOS response-associated peptidase YedK